MARSGRRPGAPDTREQILGAARGLFADAGFDRTTVRAVARSAGVDPALVPHYFGDKNGLFLACLDIEFDSATVRNTIVGDPAGLGARLCRLYLGLWEDPRGGQVARGVMRSATAHPPAAAALRDFVYRRIVEPVARQVASDRPEWRAVLAGSHLVGLAMARYVLELEPLTAMTVDEIVDAVGPVLQHYLAGPIDWTDEAVAPVG